MSKPKAHEAFAWSAQRMEDARSAAANGDGWEVLSLLWATTRPGALQWCQQNCPPDVVRQIGENGRRKRQPNKGRQYHHAKPASEQKPFAPKPRPVTCQRQWLEHGELMTCGAPTRNGADRCHDCKRHHLTLLDRKPPETQRATVHPWTEEGIQRAQRAKRSA